MAPEEISTLEAVAIYGISKVELYTGDGGEEYHRPVFCKMIVVSPVAEQNRSSSRYNRVLRLYKTPAGNPELAEAQQPIEQGQRVAINPDNKKVLKLKIDDYEFHIHAKETSLTVSRKTFASKDPIQLEKEVNQYLSGCLSKVS
jgi:hypothetical protein